MTDVHGETQELLAGYVLRSLSGEDAAEADRLLTEHVPGCPSCRLTLDAFQAVAGELGLDAEPSTPPDTLLGRLRRELDPRTRAGGRWSPGRIVAVAASVVLVVGVGGLTLTQIGGGDTRQVPASDIQSALDLATRPGAVQHDLGGNASEISAPGVQELYVYGTDVPAPGPDLTYRLWAISGSTATLLADFLPYPDGTVILRLPVDPSTFDRLLVTIEPAGSEPSEPGEPAWPSAA